MDPSEFPGNSQKAVKKKAAPPEKKVERITTGPVIRRKKPIGRRVKDFFFGEDPRSVGQMVLEDIIKPHLKDTVYDAGSALMEKRLYGEVRGRNRSSKSGIFGESKVAYHRIASKSRSIESRPEPRMSHRARATHDLGEIVLESRAEAIEAIDQLYTIVDQYEQASIADLLEMLGETPEFTDDKYGWTDLRGADVQKIREGYLLDLPRPIELD